MNRNERAVQTAQEIIQIAKTSVLGDARDEMIREVISRELTPVEGKPAVFKLIEASDIIALLGFTIGALMDDAKAVDG